MTSSAYRVIRTEQHLYDSIADFIKKKSGADNQGRLCQVLQSYADTQAHDSGLENRDSEDTYEPDLWEGFPWLTMVFGSGALELPDASGLASRLATAVEQHVTDLANSQESLAQYLEADAYSDADNGVVSAPQLAKEFTRNLAVGRLGSLGPDSSDSQVSSQTLGQSPPEVNEFAAGLVLLAALLTRLYYTAQQRRVLPVARWDGDVAALSGVADVDAEATDADAKASELLIARLREQSTRELPANDNESIKSIQSAVDALLVGIRDDLRGNAPKLALGNVRLVTEVAWYFLSLGFPIYSGWTDLLLFLTLRQGGQGANRGHAPLYRNLQSLPAMVKELHDIPTKASWGLDGARSDKQVDDSAEKRDRLYMEAANVLWAQGAAAREENDALRETGGQPPGGNQLPPAVAFVTSFDIELDMAMWDSAKQREREERRAFRIILPLHLVQQTNREFAELCWAMAEVDVTGWLSGASTRDSAAELSYLEAPKNWQLVTENTEESVLREMPIIVHLNGCPLYTIPELASQEADRLRSDLAAAGVTVDDGDHLAHAVTIGEYLALRQSEAELIWHGYSQTEARSQNRSLPKHLMVSTKRNPRYWLSMGVPVADAAVRHRLVSQLTRERLLEQTQARSGGRRRRGRAKAAPKPRIGGVAVNLRTGADAAGLLYWAGLDLVQGDCNQLTSELRHYVAHVRDSGSDQKMPETSGGICTLSDFRE